MKKYFRKLIEKLKPVERDLNATNLFEAGYEERVFELGQKPNKNKQIKTIAFHLPQFYEFEENNQWWGQGFTEWTNVVKAKPQFEGHYQPRLPHDDIGFYKLDNVESVAKQVDLAASAGIDGFCYYYYHLSGKKLLRKPVDLFTQLDTDFEFCFCWANENWTRRWDAAEHEVLARQLYDDDEIKNLIEDVSGYMIQPNYLKVDNRPLFILYEPPKVLDLPKLIASLKTGIREITGLEPYMAYIWRGEKENTYSDLFDIAVSFPLHYPGQQAIDLKKVNGKKMHSYPAMMQESISRSNHRSDVWKCCIPSWDNTSRLQERGSIFHGSNPDLFGEWYAECIKGAEECDQTLVFINAWNEWAEGNHLEPDQKYGYANLNQIWTQQQESNLF